jgi:sugar phosphate isomerase/epimerase
VEIGLAGWAFHRSILQDRSLALLDFPALARQELGVSTVELVSEFFPSQTAGYLNKLRQALEAQQLAVRCIAVDQGNISTSDVAIRRTGIEALKQWFFVAKAIGASAIRVNSDDFEPLVDLLVSRQPLPKDAIRFTWASATPDERPAILQRVVDAYRELAEIAELSGTRLLIESHGGITGEPENIARILGAVPSPWLATCPDNQNYYERDAWEQGTRVLAPRAFSAHAKISGYDPAGIQHFVSPDGSTRPQDLKRYVGILVESGYSGPLSLEYNFAEADELVGAKRGLAYVRGMFG